ncbi:hypothetical protein EFBL_2108 [Effusibacillus lacus]|uniref:DUF4321 domain-containing protein n=1 Tax=Effusibacillus lacus TaxID=1348429 RepID=A0A292YNJ3_9BACL|nr:hypothetical protein EFBL_2108 [Effusibacillus lacus]
MWRLILILFIGLTIGTIAGELLGKAFQLHWLTDAWTPIVWNPAGDLGMVKYDLHLQVKLNLASLAGMGLAYWISTKM